LISFTGCGKKNVPGGSKITDCPQTSIKHCPENVGSAFNLSRAENKNPENMRQRFGLVLLSRKYQRILNYEK
jgi:hypothetical protein